MKRFVVKRFIEKKRSKERKIYVNQPLDLMSHDHYSSMESMNIKLE